MSSTTRSAKEGLTAGLVAGVVLACAEVIAAGAMGMPIETPFRMFASLGLGQEAMDAGATSLGEVVLVGGIVHFGLSALFGLGYGLFNLVIPERKRDSGWAQAGLGVTYGAALFLVNFHVIARVAYPWFLDAPQTLQLGLHALAFGLPLGVLYAASEHAVRPRGIAHGGAVG